MVTMKNKRHSADYDPLDRFVIPDLRNDIEIAKTRINALNACAPEVRAQFAYDVALGVKRQKSP